MTYGIPYILATALGDMPVVTVQLPDAVPDGFTAVAGSGGPVMLVPTVALTPVDTTPEEPEPGAYELKHPRHSVPFIALRHCNAWVVDGGWFDSWSEFWREYGGPEVTIRRLVPEPEPGFMVVPCPPSGKMLIEHANVSEAHHPSRGGNTVEWMRHVAELAGGDEYR